MPSVLREHLHLLIIQISLLKFSVENKIRVTVTLLLVSDQPSERNIISLKQLENGGWL